MHAGDKFSAVVVFAGLTPEPNLGWYLCRPVNVNRHLAIPVSRDASVQFPRRGKALRPTLVTSERLLPMHALFIRYS